MSAHKIIIFQKITLAILAAVVLTLGVISIINPAEFIRPFGVQLEGMAGTNEIRAQYGGFLIMLGIYISRGIFIAAIRKNTLLLGVFFMGGINMGRLTDWIINQESIVNQLSELHQFFMFVLDPAGFLFALIAYSLHYKKKQ